MAALINHHRSEARYVAFNNQTNSEETYQPVNIYSPTTYRESTTCVGEKRRLTFRECLCYFFCCKNPSTSVNNQKQYYDHPDPFSSRTRRSYTLQKNSGDTQIPILTVSRTLNEEFSNPLSTPMHDTHSRVEISRNSIVSLESVNLNNPPALNCEFQKVSLPKQDKGSKKGIAYGEKSSFIREVLACRDSFLDSLEWCDNSLTRGKKCRYVKKDDWLNLECDDIEGARTYKIITGTSTCLPIWSIFVFLCT